jgi:hypothetical protein
MILNQWLIDDMIIDSLIFGFIKMVNQPERSYTISYNLFTKYNFEPMVDCTQPDIDWYIYIHIYTLICISISGASISNRGWMYACR